PPTSGYTLSLHDALPICRKCLAMYSGSCLRRGFVQTYSLILRIEKDRVMDRPISPRTAMCMSPFPDDLVPEILRSEHRIHQHLRSEEHTSELQSRENLVC